MRIWLDSKGASLNSSMEIALFSSVTSMSSGARDCLSVATALSSSSSVPPHLGHVFSSVMSRCHSIHIILGASFSVGVHPQEQPQLFFSTVFLRFLSDI